MIYKVSSGTLNLCSHSDYEPRIFILIFIMVIFFFDGGVGACATDTMDNGQSRSAVWVAVPRRQCHAQIIVRQRLSVHIVFRVRQSSAADD